MKSADFPRNKDDRGAYLQLSQALQTRLRWSWIGF